MTEQNQPKNWRRMLADIGGYENGLINIPSAGVIPIIDEVEQLRAKLDELEEQEPYKYMGRSGTLFNERIPGIESKALYLAAGARPQEASYTSVQLAEMILSDCGCSANNTSLLERVAKRIDRHDDTLSQPAPQQDALFINSRAQFLIANIKESIECDDFDGASATLEMLRLQCINPLTDIACSPASNSATPQPAPAAVVGPFQDRVQPWLVECFGEMIAGDREERNHRFLEEALELVQSLGCTQGDAHQLVDYVYGRPIGVPAQEAGGVMVSLAALCLANGMDMHSAGEVELARINEPATVKKIRAKQAAKPKRSPLPMITPTTQPAPAAQDDAADPDTLLDLLADIDKHMRAEWGARRLPASCWPTEFTQRINAAIAADKKEPTNGND